MKKNNMVIRTTAVVMSAVILFALAAACNRDDTESIYEPPEYVYTSKTIPLPSELNNVYNFAYMDGKLFFVNTYENREPIMKTPDGEDFYAYNSYVELFSMDIETNEVTKLANYELPTHAPSGATGGGVYVQSIIPDPDGNMWIIERWNYYGYEFPDDFDPNVNYPWEYYTEYGNGITIRKLDTTGAEIRTLDLSHLEELQEWFYVSAFGIDGAGNIYVAAENWEKGGIQISVLDSDGKTQFQIDHEGWINQFLILPEDGSVAFAGDSYDESGNWTRNLKKIDYASKSVVDAGDLPNIGWELFPGGGGYDFLISDYGSIYGFTIGDEEAVKVLNWLDSDVLNNGIGNIVMLPDETIVCTNYVWDRITYESSYELLKLTKVKYSELPEKTVITLATLGLGEIRESIIKFNRESDLYRIQVIDYSEYNNEQDGWDAGLTKLSTEIIAGRLPDILDVTNMPYKEYAARGLLEDLYPYIDEDPDFDRDDFVDGAFRAAEIDGSLYQLFSSFYIRTMIGHPRVVGTEIGWNMDEFQAVLAANPDADMPIGQWLNKNTFLQSAISYSIDEYIDWNRGTARFDTPDFVRLLETANTFPEEIDWDKIDWDDYYNNVYISVEEAIATGRQILAEMTIYGFGDILWYKSMFGGEITFKGFPNENRSGSSLGVNTSLALISRSKNKDAAWEFMRTTLDKDWQISYTWGMPTNKEAFNQRAETALNDDYGYYTREIVATPAPGSDGSSYVESEPLVLTQADIDLMRTLISNASGTSGWNVDPSIWNIISESISDYFAGAISAQEAARTIQSRLSILVAERS